MAQSFTLEAAWTAQTAQKYKIDFAQSEMEDDHFIFVFTCTKSEGEPFIFKAQVSPKLVEGLGINATTELKKLMKVVAGQGMADLKTRLNAGHDVNFEGLPYIKAYTLRDKANFQRFL
jgi:hypothetical protein